MNFFKTCNPIELGYIVGYKIGISNNRKFIIKACSVSLLLLGISSVISFFLVYKNFNILKSFYVNNVILGIFIFFVIPAIILIFSGLFLYSMISEYNNTIKRRALVEKQTSKEPEKKTNIIRSLKTIRIDRL